MVTIVGLLSKLLGGAGVGPLEAKELLSGGAVLIDVREPDEWDAGHAPGARHIPLGTLERRLRQVPADRRVVVVCRSGNRSAQATALLAREGRDAVNLVGGMHAWKSAGLPVEGHGGRPGVVR